MSGKMDYNQRRGNYWMTLQKGQKKADQTKMDN